jgi:hypothetical protein
MTPCSALSFNRRLEGTYILYLQGRRRWRQYVPPKRRLKLNGLYGVISQKMILFIQYLLYSGCASSLCTIGEYVRNCFRPFHPHPAGDQITVAYTGPLHYLRLDLLFKSLFIHILFNGPFNILDSCSVGR